VSEQEPSKESLREVKREYKERRKADKERQKAADKYWAEQVNPGSKRARGSLNTVGLIVLVVGFASIAFLAFGAFQNAKRPATSLADTGTTPPSTQASPSLMQASASSTPEPCKFCGTKAEHWAVGAHGLVAPKPIRVGSFGPHQVGEAYSKVIEYLKAATLDSAVVFHSQLKPVFATLGPDTTAWVHKEHSLALSTKGKKGIYWASLANRFRPSDWTSATEIRVKNKLKASLGDNSGELKIHFVNITAYWLTPKQGGEPRAVLIVREGNVYFYESNANTVSPPNLGGSGWTSTASVCGSHWKDVEFVEAWTNPREVPTASKWASAPDYNPTDLDAPQPTGCWTDTSSFTS
jgi:hypothetical protein